VNNDHYYIVIEQVTRYHKVYVHEDTQEAEVLDILMDDGYTPECHSVIHEETEWWVSDSDSDY
jgi:hypothetical protein